MTRETVFSVQEEPEIVESFVINGHDAFLVIDSTINGRSCGGLRLSPGIGLQEITDLAVAMTIKHGFLGSRGVVQKPASRHLKTCRWSRRKN